MRRRLVLAVLSVFMLAACGGGRGETCQWQPSDNPSRLDLRDRSQRLHLMDEALSAEDRAVRYADFHRGHRSGHFEGNDAYRRAREQCMAMTVEAVANHHGVTPMQAREALTYRRTSVDVFVLAVFVVFYMAVADAIVRWMFQRLPADVPRIRSVAAAVTACPAGFGGLVLFGLYSAVFEMARVGNTHMSYRADRSPWNQYQGELLIAGIMLFALVARCRHARGQPDQGRSVEGVLASLIIGAAVAATSASFAKGTFVT
jgi:hypothetical protein